MKKFPFIYNRKKPWAEPPLGTSTAGGEGETGQTERQTRANKLVMLEIKGKIPIPLIIRGLQCIYVFINHILEDLLCSKAASNIDLDPFF